MRAFSPAALASLLILTACGGGTGPSNPPPPPPGSGPVASLGLSRDAATLVLPATLQLVATPRNASGNPLGGRTVTWTSRAPAIAGVSAPGLVTSVAPGTAVIDATSEGVTASATITVLPNLGGATVLQSGSVTLPAGARIAATTLTVQNSLGSATPGVSGGFALLSIASGPQLAAAFATDGRPILLGWLDAQHTALTARTTAEVLAYFDLGGPMLPTEGRAFVMQELTHRSELNPLEDAIKAALGADPATVTLDVPAVHQARRLVQASLVPAALAAAARAPRAPQHAVQIDPLAPKSGIAVNETDLNTIEITNQYRRRAVALLDRISYVGVNGGSPVTSPAGIARMEVEATTGVTSVAGLLSDVVLGNLAWAEVTMDPVPIPLFPTNARSTQYRLLVLGLGETSPGEEAALPSAQRRELDIVVAKTMFLDLFLPILGNIVLDGAFAGDAVDDYLDSPIGAAALSDFLDVMFSTVPEVFAQAYSGDYKGAARSLITEFGEKDTFHNAVFELVAAIASARLTNPGSVQGAISDFGGKLLGFVGKIDLWMTAFDSCLQLWQIGNSRAIETWALDVVPSEIALNPPQSKIGKADIQLLKATVKGLENLAPGASLEYKWTTAGLYGGLYDANNRNVKQIIGSYDAVTYTPNLQSGGTDQITVEVTRIQAGTQDFVIGSASATVEVVDLAISLTPEDVSLRGGEQQRFTVQVPTQLKGNATLSYRWSTTGDFGTLDRGSKSFQSGSNQATYTARSQTRGEDYVMVEVLATANGQTSSLGTDQARVKVERAPFTLVPVGVSASRDTTVGFTARPNGDVPAQPKYVWNFGDNSPPVTVLNDSVTTHPFTGQGTYQVSVEMQDAATGRRLAGASGTVSIGFALSIVPNPVTTTVNTQVLFTARSLAAGMPSPLRYVWDFGDTGTLQVDADSTARHSWTTTGSYTVTVVAKHPVTGVEQARATGQVQVGFVLTQVSPGFHTCGLTGLGEAWCWGSNKYGEVGDGGPIDDGGPSPWWRTRPVQVAGGHRFSQIVVGTGHTCALEAVGSVWCWGRNAEGELGDGTFTLRTTPVLVPGLPALAAISAGGFHTCGVTSAGAVWCWGENRFGQLGDGTLTARNQPVPVLGGSNFVQISAGRDRTCGVTLGGDGWCWGSNGGGIDSVNSVGEGLSGKGKGDPAGILGVGSSASPITQPMRINGASSFAEVSAGYRYSCGRSPANTLTCWGANRYALIDNTLRGGMLGNGSLVFELQPTPTATSGETFTSVSTGDASACALSTAGEAWCWGTNFRGEVGSGVANTHYPTPVKVVGGHRFVLLNMSALTACGIKANGETWCWGDGSYGGLGDGTTVRKSTPVKVSP